MLSETSSEVSSVARSEQLQFDSVLLAPLLSTGGPCYLHPDSSSRVSGDLRPPDVVLGEVLRPDVVKLVRQQQDKVLSGKCKK